LDKLRNWKEGVVSQLTKGLSEIAKHRKIRFLRARASFRDSDTLALDGSEVERLRFEHVILATGSGPADVPGVELTNRRVMDSAGALALQDVPERLLVIGAGYIGLELGSVYAALGSRVTVVELLDGILPGVDRDLARVLERRLKTEFAQISLKTKVVAVREAEDEVEVEFEGGTLPPRQVFDRVLTAVGRTPNSKLAGLENTRVELDEKGFVKTDRQCRTADSSVLAIGDVAGQPMLAHKAMREGKVAAEGVAGKNSSFDNRAVPAVVFTDPEIAWAGLTETAAAAAGRPVKVTRFPWAACGRAVSMGAADGMTKLLFEPETGRVLGVGIVGRGAGELIAEGALAVEMGAVAEDLALTVHAHPTLAETVGEAAESFLGQATHIYRR
jgi:dihydrolipoamide dehydrogenase